MTESRRLLARWILAALLTGAGEQGRRHHWQVSRIERPLSAHELHRLGYRGDMKPSWVTP